MCMPKMPMSIKEVKDFDEDVQEMMDLNESIQMMNIINTILQDLGKDQISVQDWSRLSQDQEELVFENFVAKDISIDVAVAELMAVLEMARVEDYY